MSASYDRIEGGEFDWFAVDSLGYVGHFSTAGFGPVPSLLLQQLHRVESLPKAIQNLPTKGDAVGHLPGDISDWLAMAKRGCHSFDWQHWSGPYRRAATPSIALNYRELPANLADLVQLVEFHTVSFGELSEIRPEEFCLCEQAQPAVPADRAKPRSG